jgi:ribose transport system substrate-binding protein
MGLTKAGVVLVAIIGSAIALAACGSSGSNSNSNSEVSSAASTAETGGSEGSDAAKQAAEIVAPYTEGPSAFPVSEPLTKVPKGAKVIYADEGTPIGALSYELLQPAAKTMGVSLERQTAGTTASTASTAMDSVIAKKPDALLVGGVNIELWPRQFAELQEAGTTITATGIGPEEGLESPIQGTGKTYGGLMADYVIGEMNPNANVVMYNIPGIGITEGITKEFTERFETICPECEVRVVNIDPTTIGNTAPNAVASDLEAHRETNVAVFSADEIETGLPAALKSAGIEVETLGFAPTPTNLQYLKEGKETAGLAYDVAIAEWTQLDQAAREMAGQKLTGPEAEGLGVVQFLTQEDITFDPAKGWSAYPDFAEKFAKLWGAG